MDWWMFVISYVCGSIPFALIIGKTFYRIDIREHGSGNLGATNAFATLGPKAGIAVFLGDFLKGFLPVLACIYFGLEVSPLLVGMVAVAGHCFPVFAGFRGGKAVATSAGVLLAYNPLMLMVAVIVFFGMIWITKYVVFGSLTSCFSMIVYSFIDYNQLNLIVFSVLFIVMIYLHRTNIRNLYHKIEPTIYEGKRVV
ncbi:glycerol-3-phosphate 1-O-acyltransferase PlsY [Bacillus litorisediminis]|uniref:glycerol-3-phosphate 1-O-acyltransferase PlsY n=1 Tax=Bacillus litorisediminis TaxID=2922713 RepID=UPI001FAEBC1B|nr:glycerol-3-phosphate 1-O-acyltransferase PlsY [Bacillus litorisediminis]